MATYDVIGVNSPDGATVGQNSAVAIGFWGATPVARKAVSSAVAAVVVTTAAATTTAYGFATTAQANGIVTAVNSLAAWQASVHVALVSYGLLTLV